MGLHSQPMTRETAGRLAKLIQRLMVNRYSANPPKMTNQGKGDCRRFLR